MQPNPAKGEFLRLPKVPIEPLSFESLSERACAAMLEQYCEWKGIPGLTFQVPVGRCRVDFRVGDHLLEYHPISLGRELLTDAGSRIRSATRKLSKDLKSEILSAVADELAAQYEKRRSQVVSADPQFKGCEVFCFFTPEQFCFYLLNYGNNVPTLKTLKSEWDQHIKAAKKLR